MGWCRQKMAYAFFSFEVTSGLTSCRPVQGALFYMITVNCVKSIGRVLLHSLFKKGKSSMWDKSFFPLTPAALRSQVWFQRLPLSFMWKFFLCYIFFFSYWGVCKKWQCSPTISQNLQIFWCFLSLVLSFFSHMAPRSVASLGVSSLSLRWHTKFTILLLFNCLPVKSSKLISWLWCILSGYISLLYNWILNNIWIW